MKNKLVLQSLCLLSMAIGCNKNDDSVLPEIELQNEPPLSFDLIDIADNSTNVDMLPTLSWESAKNPKGTNVTYDLYFGKETNPTTVYQNGITETSFQINDSLSLITDYYWKVVAKDTDGKISQSPINTFTTRYYQIPDEPLFPWGFDPSLSHATTVFDNRIWVTGGYNGDVTGAVSSTSNGSIYTYHDSSGGFMGFGKRYFHQMLTYDNKMWVIGGRTLLGPSAIKEDIWSSENGLVWNQVTANASFGGKTSFGATVFDNKMWVIGGTDENFDQTNDVWHSQNGANWTQVTAAANFSKRTGHAVITFKGKIWVIGGFDDSGRKNDVWFSSNGTVWTEATSEAAFPARNSHTATVFDNKIWIVGGITGESGDETNDVWYSDNGIDWEQVQVSDSFPPRAQHTAAVFNNQLWIIGGIGLETYKDIWTLN